MSKNNFRPEYQAKLPKTDHDLSHKVVFSSSVGHLLPVFHHIVNPGENLKVNIDLFTRTQPLVTAAMVDIEENVDFFFIPFPYIFTAFEPRLYGTTDYLSSYFEQSGHASELSFPLLVSWRPNEASDDGKDFGDFWRAHLTNNPDFAKVNGALSSVRLFSHLHYNPFMPFNGTSYDDGGQLKRCSNNVMPSIFPYALYSYHAIYYNFFSNQDFERRQVSYYNADRFVFTGQNISTNSHQFFNLHYVSYGPDYFQDSFISPLLSSKNLQTNVLSNSVLQNSLRLYLGDSVNVYPADVSASSTTNDSEFVQVSANDNSLALATNQLRANFALEKYLRVLGRADKTYDAQVLAHFGFKVPTDYKHQVQHIGHFGQEIHIGEVVSTAQTYQDNNTGASLGEIVGKGYGKGVRENMVDFTAPCHGIIMAVYHARPKLIYNNFGFDRINWFTGVSSLYNPEYDALGAQPIFSTELIALFGRSWVGNPSIIRWTDRYHEYKHKFNWATLAFSEDVSTPAYFRKFNQWSSWINGSVPLRWDLNQGVDPDLYIQSNLVFPDDLDNLFTVGFVKTYNPAYIESPWLIFQGDPFMHELKFNMTLWSSMSKTGEPRMDM